MPIPKQKNELNRLSAKQQIYNELREWIIDGTLRPGEFIYDSEIAKYFSVSRTPVREAILLLSEQGFVNIKPSKGTQVTETNESSAYFIYEAISCLSAEITRLAVRKQRPDDIKELKRINSLFSEAVKAEDDKASVSYDHEFHEYILKMSDNPYLENYWHQISPHTDRYELLYFKSGMRREISIEDHEQIISAMEKHSEGEAAKYAQKNWVGFYNERLLPQLRNKENEIV